MARIPGIDTSGIRHDGGMPTASDAEVVDALLTATRALVGLAARSLADADVTLGQYRTLVVLASRGPQRVIDISNELGVSSSTGTRMCDRLVAKGLARRYRTDQDRREVRLGLTAAGRRLIDEVTLRRRDELVNIVKGMPGNWRRPVSEALRHIADATGEVPDRAWPAWQDENGPP